MSPLFIYQQSSLNKGRYGKNLMMYALVCTLHNTVAYFKSILEAVFSQNDPQRKRKEEAAYIYFMDFIEECEGR